MANENGKSLHEKLAKLTEMFRQSLKGNTNPLFLNTLYFQAGALALDLKGEHADLETNRKAYQLGIRDELMAEAEAKGEKLSRTAAEEAARADDRYVAYRERIDAAQKAAEQAELLAKAAYQRAWLVAPSRERVSEAVPAGE